MRLGGRGSIVAEVVDDFGALFSGDLDIELGEERGDGAGGRLLAGEAHEDVAAFLHEVEKEVGR